MFIEDLVSRSEDRALKEIDQDVAVVATTWYKNKGKESETTGVVDVMIPLTAEKALELIGEEVLLETSARMRIADATNAARSSVASPEAAKKKAMNAAERLRKLADEMGISVSDLLDQL